LKKLIQSLFGSASKVEAPTSPEDALFHSLFSLAGRLVVADGTVSEEEVASVEKFVVDALHLSPSRQKQALSWFEQGQKGEEPGVSTLAAGIVGAYPNNPAVYDVVLDILIQISVADNEYCEDEQWIVEEVAKTLSIPQEEWEHFRFHYTDTWQGDENAVYYNLIGSSPAATGEEIKMKFARFMSRYGPQAIHKLPEELEYYSANRYQRLEQAFKIVMSDRGISL